MSKSLISGTPHRQDRMDIPIRVRSLVEGQERVAEQVAEDCLPHRYSLVNACVLQVLFDSRVGLFGKKGIHISSRFLDLSHYLRTAQGREDGEVVIASTLHLIGELALGDELIPIQSLESGDRILGQIQSDYYLRHTFSFVGLISGDTIPRRVG